MFAQKVKNVQLAGGNGVVIYNNTTTSYDIENIVMSEMG